MLTFKTKQKFRHSFQLTIEGWEFSDQVCALFVYHHPLARTPDPTVKLNIELDCTKEYVQDFLESMNKRLARNDSRHLVSIKDSLGGSLVNHVFQLKHINFNWTDANTNWWGIGRKKYTRPASEVSLDYELLVEPDSKKSKSDVNICNDRELCDELTKVAIKLGKLAEEFDPLNNLGSTSTNKEEVQ